MLFLIDIEAWKVNFFVLCKRSHQFKSPKNHHLSQLIITFRFSDTTIKKNMSTNRHSIQQNMVLTTRQVYTCCQKVFCCKCFHCLQDDVILTTDARRQTLQRMIKNYVIHDEEDTLYDPLKLMILIYLCEDQSVPKKFIPRCRINPKNQTDKYRTDLVFYIPQICNYLVFHNELSPNYLTESVEKSCKISFYFAHIYFFNINSLEKIIGDYEIQVFKKVSEYKEKFLDEMCKMYDGQMLNSLQFFIGQKVKTMSDRSDIALELKVYGTKQFNKEQDYPKIKPSDITLPNYSSIFAPTSDPQFYSFKSTLNFFADLFTISEELKSDPLNKKDKLKQLLYEVNRKLPACVYIPFSKNSICYHNVLNVAVEETKIYSTKQRNPFYICLEVYCPAEIVSENEQIKFWQKVDKPLTLKQNQYSEVIIPKRRSYDSESRSRYRQQRNSFDEKFSSIQTQVFGQKNSSFLTSKLLEYTNEMQTQPRLQTKQKNPIQMRVVNRQMEEKFQQMFGQSQSEICQRIKQNSIYNGLSSWKLVHIMIKTCDNLKQEQFALQLIYQFDYIFKLEKLPLELTPYEVISMGPDCGIIEMVRESITFDKLKKYLKNQFGSKELSLKQFFQLFFRDNLIKAKEIFMKSLAAYSLVMYFLQAKDRHNGNIMLHRSGKIFHIDFGFFLSNLPGKGVQLQKDCPFKLLTQYIEVLDGPDSYYFKKFREYLFQGFKAIRKHQNKILMLAKMMYSSNGTSMPCFQKGQEAIKQLQLRFNPPNVHSDGELNIHCQKLINSSLDNWATKWYDRFQYFAQGIFY